MNFLHSDIIIRKSGDKQTIWLSQRLVIDVCGMSEDFLRTKARPRYKASVQACYHHHNILPDTGKGWRWAKMESGFYYDLSRIPNRAPQNYRELFGDATELVRNYEDFIKGKQSSNFETDFKRHLNNVYRSYLEFYTDANEVQRPALAKACAVIDFILDHKDSYPGTKNKLYKDLEPVLKKLDLQYIPHHHLRLKEKIDELFATERLSIPDIIKLPRAGNSNSMVFADPQLVSWALQLRSMPKNYSNDYIIRKITDMCSLTGKRVPSRRWFGQNIFELPGTKFLTSKRFGSSRKSHIHKSYIPTEGALYAGDCWEMDATRVNIIGHSVEIVDEITGKKKKVEKFLMVVAIRDVHSGDIVGYSFDHSENRRVYTDAIAMAVKNTGYLPYEIITDRFPGHNTPEVETLFARMEALGVKIEISHNANDKAGVERFFRTLQQITMPDSDFFYGDGIMSRSLSAFRSPEYLEGIKKESKKAGFDMYAAVEESTFIIETFRDTLYSKYSRKHSKVNLSPRQIHDQSEKPHVIEVSDATISMLFGLKKKNIQIRNNGQIETEIYGVKMHYFISPAYYDVIKNYHLESVVLSYDIEDLSVVYLWENHGILLKSLCEAEFFVPAKTKGPNKNLQQIGVAKAREKAIESLKSIDYEQTIGEENYMLGKYGKKDITNTADDYYNDRPVKKVSGSDVQPDDFENDYLNDRNAY
ncbi:transposase [Chryseobacterium shandongense]|uniref:Transposase n=2 Tax=Chryseobacterium TaxID=59732 RepID=A0AAD1DLT0_9FLAO|nr:MULTISPECIES: DDE-type integrase/transposase/recombinase [Chryseobacterium]AZA87126.1 transposase [Chryseobacterium shandongense]AZA95555.1 transposase [Chryseobacterium shandongense]MEC3876164.1 DDE-type integrase/transposase/recombinase [Chryseobacterium sp. T9W2-O]